MSSLPHRPGDSIGHVCRCDSQAFEQMRSAALSLLEDVSIAKTNWSVGCASFCDPYSSESRNLLRFTDHLEKKTLLEAVKTFALERTTKTRDIGQAMSFVARNIFKRVRKGRLMRKVAVFFTNGPSGDESSLAQPCWSSRLQTLASEWSP